MSFFENLPVLPYPFSKNTPSLFTLKEGSTSHLGLLPSGKKRETALLGARNRYALRLADHQRSSPWLCGMGPLVDIESFSFIFLSKVIYIYNSEMLWCINGEI